jgi:putative membrane protein
MMRLGSSPLPVGAGRGGGEQVRARDHLANVRTFLAWIRAALTLMAVGYVIEKFDIIVQNHSVALGQAGDRALAVLVVTTGISVSVGAFLRFLAARRMIDRAVFRPRAMLDMPLIIVAAVGGIVILVYLAQVGR